MTSYVCLIRFPNFIKLERNIKTKMALASPIQGISSFLENYWCRNQVFRTVQFASGMLSGLLERSYPDMAGKLMTVAGSISEMRVVLRLLDDLPALAYNLQNWRPKKVCIISFQPISVERPGNEAKRYHMHQSISS